MLNRSRTRDKKTKAWAMYSIANREVEQSIRKSEGTSWMTLQDRHKTAGKGDLKDLYSITRTLAGVRKTTDRPV